MKLTDPHPDFERGERIDNDDRAGAGLDASKLAIILTNPRLDDNPIVYVNEAFERLTGFTREAAIGRNCRFLQCDDTPREKIVGIREAIEKRRELSTVILNRRANGETFHNALHVSPVFDNDNTLVYFIGLQSESARGEKTEALESFETAIAEIQHRVKNHLSMILGLIRMSARKSDRPEDYDDLSRRIESLQLLYEEISSGALQRNDGKIQLGSYLGRVANAIAHLDGRPGVRMNVHVEPLVADGEVAVRIGLIISEVLTNAMQHAFRDQQSGLVELRVARTDRGGMRAIVTDDGVGLPEGADWPEGDGLGGRIVKGLCKGLNATLNVSRGAVGTIVTLDVPDAR